jgi:hypothetical protein
VTVLVEPIVLASKGGRRHTVNTLTMIVLDKKVASIVLPILARVLKVFLVLMIDQFDVLTDRVQFPGHSANPPQLILQVMFLAVETPGQIAPLGESVSMLLRLHVLVDMLNVGMRPAGRLQRTVLLNLNV